ncbi:hypothetical protein [Saccharopolyspora griseoalba]|uniref:Uncharacterized protein n=1 Tax=Saccharopolyspora griseoalba TaxID=1431848 RepID=A0ABW2LHV3_9PSEU
MSRPIATTVLAIALLASEGAPVAPPSSTDAPTTPAVHPAGQPPDPYRSYQQRTGYPHEAERYEQLPGHQRCGTACGREPTSGEQQLRHLCDRDLISPSRC